MPKRKIDDFLYLEDGELDDLPVRKKGTILTRHKKCTGRNKELADASAKLRDSHETVTKLRAAEKKAPQNGEAIGRHGGDSSTAADPGGHPAASNTALQASDVSTPSTETSTRGSIVAVPGGAGILLAPSCTAVGSTKIVSDTPHSRVQALKLRVAALAAFGATAAVAGANRPPGAPLPWPALPPNSSLATTPSTDDSASPTKTTVRPGSGGVRSDRPDPHVLRTTTGVVDTPAGSRRIIESHPTTGPGPASIVPALRPSLIVPPKISAAALRGLPRQSVKPTQSSSIIPRYLGSLSTTDTHNNTSGTEELTRPIDRLRKNVVSWSRLCGVAPKPTGPWSRLFTVAPGPTGPTTPRGLLALPNTRERYPQLSPEMLEVVLRLHITRLPDYNIIGLSTNTGAHKRRFFSGFIPETSYSDDVQYWVRPGQAPTFPAALLALPNASGASPSLTQKREEAIVARHVRPIKEIDVYQYPNNTGVKKGSFALHAMRKTLRTAPPIAAQCDIYTILEAPGVLSGLTAAFSSARPELTLLKERFPVQPPSTSTNDFDLEVALEATGSPLRQCETETKEQANLRQHFQQALHGVLDQTCHPPRSIPVGSAFYAQPFIRYPAPAPPTPKRQQTSILSRMDFQATATEPDVSELNAENLIIYARWLNNRDGSAFD